MLTNYLMGTTISNTILTLYCLFYYQSCGLNGNKKPEVFNY